MKAEFMAHFFFTMLSYSTTNLGMDWMPTSVAAVSCYAVEHRRRHARGLPVGKRGRLL